MDSHQDDGATDEVEHQCRDEKNPFHNIPPFTEISPCHSRRRMNVTAVTECLFLRLEDLFLRLGDGRFWRQFAGSLEIENATAIGPIPP
jgi:hypothetical protein